MLLVDPELHDRARGRCDCAAHVRARRRTTTRCSGSDRRTPDPWDGDEAATATINYTSGTTARPKGVQLTHRSLWLNATVFALHAGLNDRDVYLHTLPMFHANGWGMPYGVTGIGGRHIVIRQIDGAEILRRIDRHGVTVLCAAPAVVNAVLDAAADLGRPDPGPRPRPGHRGRRPAPDPHHRTGARRARVGVHPDLRPDRDLARCSP